jgi:hypothetical protein
VFDDVSTLVDVLFAKFEVRWGVLHTTLMIKPFSKGWLLSSHLY